MRYRKLIIATVLIAVLASADAGTVFAASEAVSLSKQQVSMERVFNFRELGGYRGAGGKRIRKGLLYRSGELSYATDKDLKHMSKDLRIRKVIDLRYKADRKYCPDREIPGTAVVHIAIKQERIRADQKAMKRHRRFTALSKKAGSREFYGTFASTRRKVVRKNTNALVNSKTSQKAYRAYFQQLLKNTRREPVLFHCIAGKDRTGVAAVMTLLALGVDEKTAIADYELTNRVYKSCGAGEYGRYSYGVSEEDLRYALKNAKKKYGTYNNFFRKAYGLSNADLKKLRKIYLK